MSVLTDIADDIVTAIDAGTYAITDVEPFGAERKQVIDPAPVPVGDVINNGYGLDVLGITIGLSIAFGIILGVLGLLLWLNAPGVADLRQRILQAMTKHKPQPT